MDCGSSLRFISTVLSLPRKDGLAFACFESASPIANAPDIESNATSLRQNFTTFMFEMFLIVFLFLEFMRTSFYLLCYNFPSAIARDDSNIHSSNTVLVFKIYEIPLHVYFRFEEKRCVDGIDKRGQGVCVTPLLVTR